MRVMIIILSACYFVGCSSLMVQPQHVKSYNNGIAIIQDAKQNSKIQFEVAQEEIGGFNNTPLLIYLVVENLQDKQIFFDINHIHITMNDVSLAPLTFEDIAHSNIDFSDALYDYGIDTQPPQTQIVDPFFSPAAYTPYFLPAPFFGTFRYGFYDYSFSRANMYAMQQIQSKVRKILIANYLRKNTLLKNNPKSGFIAIPYNRLESGDLIMQVQVGEDKYELLLNLIKQ